VLLFGTIGKGDTMSEEANAASAAVHETMNITQLVIKIQRKLDSTYNTDKEHLLLSNDPDFILLAKKLINMKLSFIKKDYPTLNDEDIKDIKQDSLVYLLEHLHYIKQFDPLISLDFMSRFNHVIRKLCFKAIRGHKKNSININKNITVKDIKDNDNEESRKIEEKKMKVINNIKIENELVDTENDLIENIDDYLKFEKITKLINKSKLFFDYKLAYHCNEILNNLYGYDDYVLIELFKKEKYTIQSVIIFIEEKYTEYFKKKTNFMNEIIIIANENKILNNKYLEKLNMNDKKDRNKISSAISDFNDRIQKNIKSKSIGEENEKM